MTGVAAGVCIKVFAPVLRPALAASAALMHAPERRPLADVMTALRLHCSVAEAGLALASNAEQRLHERETLARRYPPALLAETLAVAERCTFSLGELRYEYPAELVPAGETPASWLRRLVEGGLAWRYREQDALPRPADDPAPPPVRAQIEHELALIAELGYEPVGFSSSSAALASKSCDIRNAPVPGRAVGRGAHAWRRTRRSGAGWECSCPD